MNSMILTDKELKNEIARCEYCETRPCVDGCPAGCSPFDFIMAIKPFQSSDFKRAAALLLEKNPFGASCPIACGDQHCVKACTRNNIDNPVRISKIHATIIERARKISEMPSFVCENRLDKRIAIVGAGPAGLTAAFTLSKIGYTVDIFEKEASLGGALRLIPHFRIPREILDEDIFYLLSSSENIKVHLNQNIDDLSQFSEYYAIIVGGGLSRPIKLGIKNEELAVDFERYLRAGEKYNFKGDVCVVGGGATAIDCALTAKKNGARSVNLFSLENLFEMVVPPNEILWLRNEGIGLHARIKVSAINMENNVIKSVNINDVELVGERFDLSKIMDIEGSQRRRDVDHVIVAIGARKKIYEQKENKIFYAGDYVNGPATVAEAVASGKECATAVHRFLDQNEKIESINNRKSKITINGYKSIPIALSSDFFGRKIESPFLLSASPLTDGYDQVKKAYDAGWSGAIMKTAFDNIPIHIPSEYMFFINENTYGNCDNVSGHSLTRVCDEIKRLIRKYPDKLTMASTGGSVTGNDTLDKKSWQGNTRLLEDAGALGIEYSLSCPQGGDGTEGDIVSQNANLTAKIIDWVLEISDPAIPKLFKLTAQVTSIEAIISAIKKVFQKYPSKKAGVTLANTFPAVEFRRISGRKWLDGVVLGMSGEGVLPISYLTLAKVSNMGTYVSGNAGPMNYMDAANFLALGARSVQFCTIATKYGYRIINELHSGLSHLLAHHGLKSVNDLIGIALPDPILDFMRLPATKMISDADDKLCITCGNCSRCPYLAITLDAESHPKTDPSKCIGCSICAQKCVSGALFMRERTGEELALLCEK